MKKHASIAVVALLLIAFAATRPARSADPQAQGAARQSWDYKLVEIFNDMPVGAMTPKWVWQEDGVQLPGAPAGKMVAKSKELGDAGWEMFSVSSAGQPIRTYYWFKRPK